VAWTLYQFWIDEKEQKEKKVLLWNVRLATAWQVARTMVWHGICTLILWLSENKVCVAFYSLKSMEEEVTLSLENLLEVHD